MNGKYVSGLHCDSLHDKSWLYLITASLIGVLSTLWESGGGVGGHHNAGFLEHKWRKIVE